MSFQDPSRRRRQPRSPALVQYQDGFPSYQDTVADFGGGGDRQDGSGGFAGLGGAPRQRPPWEAAREEPGRRGAHRATRTTGGQHSARNSGGQQSVGDTGGQRSLWNTGEQRSLWDTGGQQTAWDTPAQDTEWEPARRTSGAFRAAQDDNQGLRRGAGNGDPRRSRGLLAGGVAGFLAAAVALGVANLIAAFVRPQASPIIAVGEAFIDRTPSALKNFAIAKFGENDKNMLLLGMYVTIALIAVAIGIFAWRRLAVGIAGIGLFGLFGAFVAITRPESHITDVIPSVIGGIAGIAAIVWLVRSGMPGRRAAWARGR